MKRFLIAAALLLPCLSARAGLVFNQPHTGTGALLASSRYQANGTDYDQWVWDSFSVPTAQAITEIRWRGGYLPEMAYWGGIIFNFKVSIYESTPGLSQPLLGPGYPVTPATLVSYDTGNTAGETSAGMFGGVEMFDYHFVLPTVFQAQAGKLYWVQIEAEMGNGLPHWGMATGTGNGSYFRRLPEMFFQFPPGDAAFGLVTADGPTYTVAASSAPAGGGTIANAGWYPNNSAAPLIATPNAGYAFANWTDNGTVVSTASNYTFTVTGNRTLVANFAAGSTITTTASPLTGGTTNGDGSFSNGSTRTVEAVPSANYTFVNWGFAMGAGGNNSHFQKTTGAPYTNRTGDLAITLSAATPTIYAIAATSSADAGGTVAGPGTYALGETVTLSATVKTGYAFVKWTEAGTTVSTSPSFTFAILTQHNLMANFAVGFTMTATSSFAPGGSVSGAGGYATGGAVTLVATPATGYQFTNWTEGGTIVNRSASYSFTATANRTLVANFVPIVGITNPTPGTIGIVWPASATGWVLQESQDLSSASWVDSNLSVDIVGGENHVAVWNPAGRRFFRLSHP